MLGDGACNEIWKKGLYYGSIQHCQLTSFQSVNCVASQRFERTSHDSFSLQLEQSFLFCS